MGRRRGGEIWNDKLSRIRKKASIAAKRAGLVGGFRSGLEVKMAILLSEMGIEFDFEGHLLEWTPLPIKKKYHPDFPIVKRLPDGRMLIIETKGRFMPDDMAKIEAVKVQHPEVVLCLVFQNPRAWFRRAKTRNYAKWCSERNIPCCGFKEAEAVIKRWVKGDFN